MTTGLERFHVSKVEHLRKIGRRGRNRWVDVCYFCGEKATHTLFSPDGGSTTNERSHWDIRGVCDECGQKAIDRGVKVKGLTHLYQDFQQRPK